MQAGPLLRLLALALALSVGLSACAPVTVEPEAEAPALAEARELERSGQAEAAAEAYLQAAAQAPAAERAALQLTAARLFLDADRPGRTRTVLEQLDAGQLSDAGRWELQLLTARLAVLIGDAETALALLPDTVPPFARPLHPDLLRVRAEAYALLGHHLEVARTRVALDAMLSDPEAQLDNRRAIWSALDRLTPQALEQLTLEPPPDVLSGWLELATTLERAGFDNAAIEQALTLWRQRYPAHPADGTFLEELLVELRKTRERPGTIALLLPADGPLATAAAAIRNGFLAAYYRDPKRNPDTRVQVYDSNLGEADIWSLYRTALDEGAELIVGPLDKRHVATLAAAGELQVPVLALNAVDDLTAAPPEGLYQFGLAPEDDARQVAERAALEGLGRAVALVPEGEWGGRGLDAFAERFAQVGGELVESQRYDPSENDFTAPIRRLLNLDQSEARHQALRQVTRRNLHFEPRRRQDVDFVFVAAFPRQARLIAPQLRFHRAADLPVYATSHAFTGTADPRADQDMDGVTFCDLPWILQPDSADQELRATLENLWPQDMDSYPRLFALGVDAYRLLPYLEWLASRPHERWPGSTGLLHMDNERRVHRTLQWARVVDGEAVTVRESLSREGSGPPPPGLRMEEEEAPERNGSVSPAGGLIMEEERPDEEGTGAPAARP